MGCRSGSEAARRPVVAPLPAFPIIGPGFETTCEIADTGGSIAPLQLRARGRVFATVKPEGVRVRANRDRAAAVVTVGGITLFGELDLGDVVVWPRSPLAVDGMEIVRAPIDHVETDELVLATRFPARVLCAGVRLAPIYPELADPVENTSRSLGDVLDDQLSRVYCAHDVPIYVRIDGELLRVGTVARGHGVPRSADSGVEIRLAAFRGPLPMLVRAPDLESCAPRPAGPCG